MGKLLKSLLRRKMLVFAVVLGAVIYYLKQPWYIYLLIYSIFMVTTIVTNYGTTLGHYGYFVQAVLKKQDKANQIYEKALAHNTKSNYALTAYGLDLLRNSQPEKALEVFKKNYDVKNIRPLFIKYTEMNLSTCYWKLGDVKKSIEILEDMYEKYDYFTPDFYTTFAYMFLEDGNIEQALYFTKEALHENKSHGPAYDNMGQIYYRLGEYEKAGRYLRKALSFKDMVDSKYYLGLVEEKLGNLDKAKEYFGDAMESNINGFNTITKEMIEKKYKEYC